MKLVINILVFLILITAGFTSCGKSDEETGESIYVGSISNVFWNGDFQPSNIGKLHEEVPVELEYLNGSIGFDAYQKIFTSAWYVMNTYNPKDQLELKFIGDSLSRQRDQLNQLTGKGYVDELKPFLIHQLTRLERFKDIDYAIDYLTYVPNNVYICQLSDGSYLIHDRNSDITYRVELMVENDSMFYVYEVYECPRLTYMMDHLEYFEEKLTEGLYRGLFGN